MANRVSALMFQMLGELARCTRGLCAAKHTEGADKEKDVSTSSSILDTTLTSNKGCVLFCDLGRVNYLHGAEGTKRRS